MSEFLLALLICGPGCAMALWILWWMLLDYDVWLGEDVDYRVYLSGWWRDED